jgi:hypothetical protein
MQRVTLAQSGFGAQKERVAPHKRDEERAMKNRER